MQPDANAPQNVNPTPQVTEAQPQFQTAPAPQVAPEQQPQTPAPQPSVSEPQVQPQTQPAPEPQSAPVQQSSPQPQTQPQSATPDYDKLLDSYLGQNSVPTAPAPNLADVKTEEDLVKFFDDFATNIEQRAAQRTMQQMRQLENDKAQEKQAWDKVFEKYPNASNPTIRHQIHTLRLGAMVAGGNADLMAAADQLLGQNDQSYQQGYQAANQQTYVQRSQHLANNNVTTPPANISREQAYDQMAKPGSEGQQAAISHVQSLIDAGLI